MSIYCRVYEILHGDSSFCDKLPLWCLASWINQPFTSCMLVYILEIKFWNSVSASMGSTLEKLRVPLCDPAVYDIIGLKQPAAASYMKQWFSNQFRRKSIIIIMLILVLLWVYINVFLTITIPAFKENVCMYLTMYYNISNIGTYIWKWCISE